MTPSPLQRAASAGNGRRARPAQPPGSLGGSNARDPWSTSWEEKAGHRSRPPDRDDI